MAEQIIIGILFVLALAYLTKNSWLSLNSKKKCASGCGSCQVAKIEEALDAVQPSNQ